MRSPSRSLPDALPHAFSSSLTTPGIQQGRSNAGIASALVLSHSAVAKHINSIFTKLDIPPAESDNRRVLAVLRYLRDRHP